MLHDVVEDPGALAPDELLAALADRLAAVVEAVGEGAVAEATGLPPPTVGDLKAGDCEAAGSLDVAEAAAVLALAEGAPDAEAIAAAARDDLLFGMTTGVLNVDVVAGEVALDVDPKEVQGMLEGRHPMTLREFAALQAFVASRAP